MHGLAVDQANGDVVVAEAKEVLTFVPVNRSEPSAGYTKGTPMDEPFTVAFGVGVDNSSGLFEGDVYVDDLGASGENKIDKFVGPGKPEEGQPVEVNPPSNTTNAFGAGASPPLGSSTGVAVDPSDGYVYVSDGEHNVIDVYTPLGEFSKAFSTIGNEPRNLAFNGSGSDLYVVTDENHQVEEFDASSGSPVDQTAGPHAGENILDNEDEPSAVAVDLVTNEVYVDQRGDEEVAVFDASGAPVQTFPVGFGEALAIDDSTHTVFVSDLTTEMVNVYQRVELPEATTGAASHVTETATETRATLEGVVNLEGAPITSCDFEYATSTFYEHEHAYEHSVPCQQTLEEIRAGTGPVPVTAEPTGLLTHTTYHFRLVAGNASGTVNGVDETFGPPIVSGESFSEVGLTGATVQATVNGEGYATTYHFEYGPTEAYGFKTAEESLSPVNGRVSATLSGLVPGTVYHFRLVASDERGTALGADVTFTTFSSSVFTPPDGRVYEMVTPVENEDVNVHVPESPSLDTSQSNAAGTRRPFQAAADGNAVAYVGDPHSGGVGTESGGTGNEFLATRIPTGGWTQVGIQPPAYVSATYQAFSSDLSVGILDSCEADLPVLSAGAPGGGYDVLYSRASGDGSYHALFSATPPNRSPQEFGAAGVRGANNRCFSGQLAYAGANAGTGTVPASSDLLFEADDALLTSGGTLESELDEDVRKEVKSGEDGNDLYDAVAGRLSLVNVLPDGTVAPHATFGSAPSSVNEPPDFSHVISADGSRIFWTDLHPGADMEHLYVRESGEKTVAVSEGPARFWTATPDGQYAYYTEGEKLWRFDVEGETREELAGAGAEVQGVIGAGEDGSYVYFVADGALAPGATPQTCTPGSPSTGCNLYVRHDGVTTFIATLSSEDDENGGGDAGEAFGDWRPGLGWRTAEVTPDGQRLVFMSQRSLTGYDNTAHGVADQGEVYVYDADAGRLFCASCDPSGEPPSIDAGNEASYLPVNYSDTYLPRWISEDGSRVFFDSVEPLTPLATDGKQNVYEWERYEPESRTDSCTNTPGESASDNLAKQEKGCVYLLSGGTSTDASFLIDASANGDDVFIATRAQLVPEDQNDNFNLFDARVGGVQPISPSACSGTGCQGVPSAAPIFATPSSVTFNGVGNFAPSSTGPVVKLKAKPLTRAQKLSKALAVCRTKRNKHKRAVCRAQARKKYGPLHEAKKTNRKGKS